MIGLRKEIVRTKVNTAIGDSEKESFKSRNKKMDTF